MQLFIHLVAHIAFWVFVMRAVFDALTAFLLSLRSTTVADEAEWQKYSYRAGWWIFAVIVVGVLMTNGVL